MTPQTPTRNIFLAIRECFNNLNNGAFALFRSDAEAILGLERELAAARAEAERLHQVSFALDLHACEARNATLRARVGVLEEALKTMVDRYTSMVNSGDCGNWDPEEDEPVIKARQALADAKPAEGEKP